MGTVAQMARVYVTQAGAAPYVRSHCAQRTAPIRMEDVFYSTANMSALATLHSRHLSVSTKTALQIRRRVLSARHTAYAVTEHVFVNLDFLAITVRSVAAL